MDNRAFWQPLADVLQAYFVRGNDKRAQLNEVLDAFNIQVFFWSLLWPGPLGAHAAASECCRFYLQVQEDELLSRCQKCNGEFDPM